MVAGEGNGSWESWEPVELAGELGGGLLESGVLGGVNIQGVSLIFFTHFDNTHSKQYILPQIPHNIRNIIV